MNKVTNILVSFISAIVLLMLSMMRLGTSSQDDTVRKTDLVTAMKSEAGTPLPDTSPMQKNSLPSRKWKSKRSPPTSFAGVSVA